MDFNIIYQLQEKISIKEYHNQNDDDDDDSIHNNTYFFYAKR